MKNYKQIYAYQEAPGTAQQKKKQSLSLLNNNNQQQGTNPVNSKQNSNNFSQNQQQQNPNQQYQQQAHKKAQSLNTFMFKNMGQNISDLQKNHSKNFQNAINKNSGLGSNNQAQQKNTSHLQQREQYSKSHKNSMNQQPPTQNNQNPIQNLNQNQNDQQQFQQQEQEQQDEKQKPLSFLNYLLLKDLHNQQSQQGQSDEGDAISFEQEENYNYHNKESGFNKFQFQYHYVIGKGGFGKVWKVEHKKQKKYFALKEMSKALIITKKSVNSVMNERHLLQYLKHEFLVNMQYAFQDRDNLYLVMDIMYGGDLRYHIGRQRRFNEEQTKFFVCCIFSGLQYLHLNNIIHRDIKPENLVLDEKGYVRITDLGIAREWKPDNQNDTSGTPGYMAPEVLCRQPHTYAVDYFALGVLAYEFMLGRRPYLGRSRKEIRDVILAKRVQIKKNEIPPGWSIEAVDFINKLIERKPANRLGINGPYEVRNHPWIKNYPWQKLHNKELLAPFIPVKQENFDLKQQVSLEDEQNQESFLRL
ncbi:Protein kinase-like domain [Pseudocohnilembus persalinus]|uniref:non-specific serine/threonine protein kinase n=1 Tax=Pseudocohnilembus persalinus TaxID=266149 RepID=A0A0V0R8V5_PSEPJ|nr:Protein kinase-like domain [Pseudocohnilembus persalinus]|eukprot:KRX10940.1 Protein kinase-like domain [Pseudocohnilembus persalinus]